ncbi:diguanylate cyclase domain-containing protein [Thalassolituus sp. LLYu03]|uniref:diguanylate cyclase domain-containing protein n=1 Tax=Thalassolituus sp. LLYu03 TaxID=3421656 RepID=UPI003D27C373
MNSRKPLTEVIPGLTRKPRLMIVDDQPLIIRVLNEIFKAEFEVFMATTGQQALAMCAVNPPDIMLLDVMMPEMDGYEVCRMLKASQSMSDFPVIFVTAQNDVVDEVRAFDVGGVDFISKPINPLLVTARVRTHVTVKLQRDILTSMVTLDGLTGVSNRRYFDEQLLLNWRQCQRDQCALSLILIDIDCFKQYNDRYGHIAGDAVLQNVAGTLRSLLKRPLDSFSRYGGEEFVCLLPATEHEGAALVADHMLEAVHRLGIQHEASSVAAHVTISAGVATMIPDVVFQAEQLVAAADEQLYRAKREGRDRACLIQL